MEVQLTEKNFNEFYNNTYNTTLKYTICNCNNLDDVNDLIQDSYLDIYNKILKKKCIVIENPEAYMIGVLKKKIRWSKLKNNNLNIIHKEKEEFENIQYDTLDLDYILITRENVFEIWNYIKSKNQLTAKVFYLYYILDMSIKEISIDLQISESNTKNYLYRTKKEIKEMMMKKGDDDNAR